MTTSTYDITYADRVGMAILRMKNEEVFVISENVKQENRAMFIDVVKSYIDRDFGRNEGWEIIFSNDYSKIKKINLTQLCQTIKTKP